MATPSTMQSMAAQIFSDMVMEEAIKDKTIQVEKQMKDAEGRPLDPTQIQQMSSQDHHAFDLPEEDEALDEEEEKILRSLRDKRMEEMKHSYAETQSNLAKGHG